MTNKSRAHGTASTSLAAAGNGADGAGTELTAPRHSASPPALPPMTESTAAAPSTPPRPVCRFDLESPVVLHPIGTSLSSPRLAVESVMAHHFDMPVSESQLSSLVKRDFHHVWSTFTALHDSRRLLENWTVPRLEREWRRWLLRCVQEAEKKDEFNARLKQTKKVQIIHSGQHYRMTPHDYDRRPLPAAHPYYAVGHSRPRPFDYYYNPAFAGDRERDRTRYIVPVSGSSHMDIPRVSDEGEAKSGAGSSAAAMDVDDDASQVPLLPAMHTSDPLSSSSDSRSSSPPALVPPPAPTAQQVAVVQDILSASLHAPPATKKTSQSAASSDLMSMMMMQPTMEMQMMMMQSMMMQSMMTSIVPPVDPSTLAPPFLPQSHDPVPALAPEDDDDEVQLVSPPETKSAIALARADASRSASPQSNLSRQASTSDATDAASQKTQRKNPVPKRHVPAAEAASSVRIEGTRVIQKSRADADDHDPASDSDDSVQLVSKPLVTKGARRSSITEAAANKSTTKTPAKIPIPAPKASPQPPAAANHTQTGTSVVPPPSSSSSSSSSTTVSKSSRPAPIVVSSSPPSSSSTKKNSLVTTPRASDSTQAPSPAAALRYVHGWDYEGYYTRWSEQLGVDILISSLLLSVGSWFHFDSFILGLGPGSTGYPDGGYSRIVEDGLFWRLNKSEGDRMNLGVDDITHRWKEAMRKARKLTVAVQKRIHSLLPSKEHGHQGVCLQMLRGPTPDGSSLHTKQKTPQQANWMRFVPFSHTSLCKCFIIQHATPDANVATQSLSLGAEVPETLPERMFPLYAPMMAVLQQYQGSVVLFETIVDEVLADTHDVDEIMSLMDLVPQFATDFQVKSATGKEEGIDNTPFFQSPRFVLQEEVDDCVGPILTKHGLRLMVEYLLHCQRFHAWAAVTHKLHIELSHAPIQHPSDPPELQVSLIPTSELARRARVRHIVASFATKDKIAAAASAGLVLPSEAKAAAERAAQAKVAPTTTKAASTANEEARKKEKEKEKEKERDRDKDRDRDRKEKEKSTKATSSTSDSKKASAPSSSAASSTASTPVSSSAGREAYVPQPRVKKPVLLWNSDDRFSFFPADPTSPTYTRDQLAAMYVRSAHLRDIAPGHSEWTHAVGPPITAALVPPLVRTLLPRESGESAEAFRDRIVFEGFLPYVFDRWLSPREIHQAIGAAFTDLKPVWATLKKAKAAGTEGGFEDWIHAALQQLFASPPGGPTLYVRAQMMMQQLRITRRLAATGSRAESSTADADSVRYHFTKDASLIPVAPSPASNTPAAAVKKEAAHSAASSSSSLPSHSVSGHKRSASSSLDATGTAGAIIGTKYEPGSSSGAANSTTTASAESLAAAAAAQKRRKVIAADMRTPANAASLSSWGVSSRPPRSSIDEHKSAVRESVLSSSGTTVAASSCDSDDVNSSLVDLGSGSETASGAQQAEIAQLRRANAQLESLLAEATRCGTCSKRRKGTAIFPCGHLVWCEICARRNLSLDQPLEDGQLTLLTRGPASHKFYCPITQCSMHIKSVIRVTTTVS